MKVKGPRLDHFDEMGQRADFRGEQEYGEIVVGDETFGGAGKLGADGV